MSSELRNKLLNWEAPLPENGWNKISALLDSNTEYQLSQKLQQFQKNPPGHIWDKIEQQLSTPEVAPVVPFFHKYRQVFKYGVAAAVLIVVGMFIGLLVINKSDMGVAERKPALNTMQQNPFPPQEKDNELPDATENGPSLVQKPNPVIPGKNNNAAATITRSQDKRKEEKRPERFEVPLTSLQSNRYVMHTNNSGDAVKLSRKLYSLFQCSELWTDKECKEQIEWLQQKAANPSMVAAADFTGVLELLKNMEE